MPHCSHLKNRCAPLRQGCRSDADSSLHASNQALAIPTRSGDTLSQDDLTVVIVRDIWPVFAQRKIFLSIYVCWRDSYTNCLIGTIMLKSPREDFLMAKVLGIDLGTTNSACLSWKA